MNIKQLLIGKPFPSSSAHHERLDNIRGLAVFASDPISSNAYATEAIMRVLILISAAALSYTLPIAIGIAALVLLVVLSYNQTIHHYPMGGGAYMVSKDNLGRTASWLAGASILSDYVLTVAVSVSAGVKAISSAFPDVAFFHEHRVLIGIGIILLITWLNLRGLRESGTIFAIPTYAFVIGVFLVLAVGMARYFGIFGEPLPPRSVATDEAARSGLDNFGFIWLVLRAFAGGCTALTGIEAISDGVQAFKNPAPKNAIITMRAMAIMAMTLFIGISFIATHIPITILHEGGESVLSQMTRTVVGSGFLYYWVQFTTMFILILAANTAYADFPRIAAFLSNDGFLPRWLSRLGSRLVYSSGVIALAFLSSVLLAVFGGEEHHLLPLYAIGVFLSFTLSQAGMIVMWRKVAKLKPGESLNTGITTLHYEPNYKLKRIPSMIGVGLTAVVLVVLTVTKFTEGAWLIILALPLIMLLFRTIKKHYDHVATNLSLTGLQPSDLRSPADVAIVPVGSIHRGSLRAIKYALKLTDDVRVVQVVGSDEEEAKTRKRWEQWDEVLGKAKLVFLHTDYRDYLTPLVDYVDQVNSKEFPSDLITVVIPEFVPDSTLAKALHNQTAVMLLLALRKYEDVVVISVPYHLHALPGSPEDIVVKHSA
ncbi:APC family permease [Herpetosiphon llansteffanensis]|uniref:APC family permease n=1 Tax=Herpetosiphon llansteffanensis TaxID=2094568 RepID=UPI000D7BCF43|nr:APC family permease [Herpetosiphon llansteffanensis]